jgi:hypothetical protein
MIFHRQYEQSVGAGTRNSASTGLTALCDVIKKEKPARCQEIGEIGVARGSSAFMDGTVI